MKRSGLIALVLVLLIATPAATQDGFLATTLDNGLRVVLQEDRRSPIVSFQVWYRVGSRNELPGATGIAHFLEHLMFKGTPKYGPQQFARLIEQNGGGDNAFTTHDVTSYFVNIAADRLDLVLDLESDRMVNLLLDPKAVDSEREVVIEERRTRTEDDPGGFLSEEMGSLAFKAHPYGRPVIGWMDDIKRITTEEIRAFYKIYYVPNNAVVVAVGDFKAAELLEKIKQTFGRIPRGQDPPKVTSVEPPQNGQRRVLVHRREARVPLVYMAYHVPNHTSKDAHALEMLSMVLSGGRASRIYQSLIQERHLALNAGGDYSFLYFDPYLFWLWATPLPGQTPETLEKELLAEIEKLKTQPVAPEELERARNQIEAAFVFQEDSIHRRASLIGRFEMTGGYQMKDDYLQKIRAVTPDDITRVARAYFQPRNTSVGVLLPQP